MPRRDTTSGRYAMRKRGRVYRVYKRCYVCGAIIQKGLLCFGAFWGEPMCPACKRREREYMERALREVPNE